MWKHFYLYILLAVVPFDAFAQTVSGTIAGHVTDSSNSRVPGAKLTVKSEQTDQTRESVTNAEGFFNMAFMPIGTYEITVVHKGFQTVFKRNVAVGLNNTTMSDFVLKPSQIEQTVEVTGETPLVDTSQGDMKFNLNERQIEDTPLAGRNFISLVEQIPGFQNAPWIDSSNNPTNSTGSYASFNGTGSRSTTFQIDGVNNDDSSENQHRQSVNISTIREFQIITNAYTAEFGRAGGAVVLVQTKSGTNKFHGDAYDFFQNANFNANSFFNNQNGRPRPSVDRNQYGWTVGGPLIKDRLFFFHSAERLRNIASASYTRFIWLPSDGPRPCNIGETAKPGGPYCLDPALHPNMDRDIGFMKDVMSLWNTTELKGKTPNDPVACADLIASGRPNRCVTVDGVTSVFPDSDYSGKIDWLAPRNTSIAMRYQYSRQIRHSGRLIAGDNFGTNNNRQYNLGLTATHVFSPRQTGELRFGFGNRATLQDVTDGNNIPTIRFSSTLYNADYPGTVIGTSTNVPINRRQHDTQLVYNHTIILNRNTVKFGLDQRFLLLDDMSGDRARGYWTFGTNDGLAAIRSLTGWTGWENFLRGYNTSYQQGFGNPTAENRYNETNLYFQDDFRPARNLTLNLGVRWEGVGAPHEAQNRFDYGFGGDYNNIQPRFGFAWSPNATNAFLSKITGRPRTFVIRGGYGIFHSRIFQSVFSQNQLSIRTQPPNGYAAVFGQCPYEISDPTCGFKFTPGTAARSSALSGGGVNVAGGQTQGTLLLPDRNLQMPYVQQWNFTVGRSLPKNMAIEISYNGNRGIGNIFYDSINDARFPIASPLVTADAGEGKFVPVVFDRACYDASDPICRTLDATGATVVNSSGTLKTFSALSSTTATLAQKGIVIVDGVPHGYISLGTPRVNERRPDPTYVRNVALRNFGWSYYHGGIVKFTKRTSKGLSLTSTWTHSKAIDTGSEPTFTGVDSNAPSGKGNAARSLRGLSSYDARNRVVVSYGYELPWYRTQKGLIGRVAGGWQVTGVSMFQSGTPYTVTLGYDANLDGLGSDRPKIADASYLFRSVDNGRGIYPCPTVLPGGAPCPDSQSQNQVPGNVFIPGQSGSINADQRTITPGADGSGSIGRNTFFTQGLQNFDTTFQKGVVLRERFRLTFRMEFYNLLNRVTFGVPARTVLSSIPMSRITTTRAVNNYVNSGIPAGGARLGQMAIRLTF